MKKSWKVALQIFCFAVCMALAAAVLWIDNSNYHDKMDILYTVLAAEDLHTKELPLVTSILKGNTSDEMQQAIELLESYGYIEDYDNIYQKDLIYRRRYVIGVAIAIWGLFVAVMRFTEATCKKKREREMAEITETVSAIRTSGKSVQQNFLANLKCPEDVEGKLRMELESLTLHTALIKEQAAFEKEETKALVTDISHQLKTPVTALKTSFEILNAKGLTKEEQSEFKERCSQQIIRLQELVTALINISRMEKGMIVIKKENCRIFDTVVLAMNRVYQNAEEKHIEILVEAKEEMEKHILAHDPKWMAEAIINLLENAVKYSTRDSTITIRIMEMTTFLRIEIEDEGIGVPKEEWNLIFRRFYRGQNEVVQSQQGSGVGLFLARKILELHRGTLTVAAPRGLERGSLFVMQIGIDI